RGDDRSGDGFPKHTTNPLFPIFTHEAAHHRTGGFREAGHWNTENDIASVDNVCNCQRWTGQPLKNQEEDEPAKVLQETLKRDGGGEPAQEHRHAALELRELEEAVLPVETPPDISREVNGREQLGAHGSDSGAAHPKRRIAELPEDEDV